MKNLAWQGIRAQEKRKLLDQSRLVSKKLEEGGKIKDSFLNLASTCIDIVGTAEAVKNTPSFNANWKKLERECRGIMKNTIRELKPKNFKDWSPSDLEVMATILFLDSYKNINKAKKYINEGIGKAARTKNKNSEALLLAQLIKLDVGMCNENLVPKEIKRLLSINLRIRDPKILTRTYRAIAIGSKFLAMEIARMSKLENQVLKAKNI